MPTSRRPPSRPPRTALAAVLALLAGLLSGGALTAPARAAAPAPGLSDVLLAPVPSPTALAFTPDRLGLITSRTGQLRVLRADGTLAPTPALDLSARLCSDTERGLLGVAVDPAFADNRWVYLFWTRRAAAGGCPSRVVPGPVHRVSRFTLPPSLVVDPASERVLLDGIPSPGGFHNAGDLQVGADRMLYVTVGDGGCDVTDLTRCGGENGNSRRADLPLGKVLRVTRTGGVPRDNPNVGAPGARRCAGRAPTSGAGPCLETWASGLRNPFRAAVRPGTSELWVGDVGQTAWEEVDRVAKGADYGWPRCEGSRVQGSSAPCDLPGATPPLFEYSHRTGCTAITGGAFVPGAALGEASRGSYLYADYVCGAIFERRADGSTRTLVGDLGESSAVALTFGPFGSTSALYYLSFAGGGAVHRVVRRAATSPPVAALTAAPLDPDARSMTLDGSASYDPDGGDRVASWRWDFGDGTTAVTTSPTVAHTFPRAGPSTASLVVVDTTGRRSSAATRRVVAGDAAPVVRITGTDPSARYAVDQVVPLGAEATDREDGPFAGTAVHWQVRLRHHTHQHPRGSRTGSSITVRYGPPEDLDGATDSSLEVLATVTDSAGTTVTSQVTLLPRTVRLTFGSDPAGRTLLVQGEELVAPQTVTSWVGWELALSAPGCSGWSDGGACDHRVVTPGSDTAYVARF